ncbi:MAG: glutaminyl-peptide cyclotransferase [Bacteroidales bacterium]
MKKIISLIIVALIFVVSCRTEEEDKEDKSTSKKEQPEKKKQPRVTKLILDGSHKYTIGDNIEFQIEYPDSLQLDSIKILINNQREEVIYEEKAEIPSEKLPVGTNNLRFEVFLQDKDKEVLYKRLEFKSDIEPKLLSCNIKATYPHDSQAYTQGLFYEDGYLYEGTGQKGQSSLRKINLESGELISSRALPNQYFGEGITAYKDKIIQLTWTSRVGFIYDKEEFKLLRKVRYPTEGWGLTTDGEKLFMSDGSEKIYILNPENFSEIDRFEVYDNEGSIENLNELEYVDGEIYANVWQEDYIISFNPENGKVLEKIDCSNLVPEKFKGHHDYVLNGIAYDNENERMLLTGKRWPKIYHVEFPGL